MRKIRVKTTAWIIVMAALSLMLFIIIDARVGKSSEIIFGSNVIQTDDYSVVVPIDETKTDEKEVDDGWPDIDVFSDDEKISRLYSIVNDDNLLSAVSNPDEDGYLEVIPSAYVTYSCKFDKDAMPYLTAMLDACREAGYSIYVNSGYISYSYQEILFNGTASGLAEQMGLTTDYLDPEYQKAVEKAKTITRYPGASEHQLGLCVDIVDGWHTGKLSYSNMDQDMYAWLDEHCAEYGFIKRYPTKKLLLTGLDESWHYRYVGIDAAKYIMENDICLEQFYAHYDPEFTY